MLATLLVTAALLPSQEGSTTPCMNAPVVLPAPAAGGWTFEAEYVVWWLRRAYAPPVLTTGPAASRGVAGQAGVRPVYGDEWLPTRHDDRFIGTRFALEWLAPDRSFGVEGRAFFLERDSTYFTLKHRTEPLLALSYVDASTGQEASEVIAGPDPRRGRMSGGFVGYSRIELFGQEVNGVVPLVEEEQWRLDLLAGVRFLQMRDRYHHTATSRFGPDESVLSGVEDNYRIHNAFYGGQLGLRGEYRGDRWFVRARGTVALGADAQLVRTFGERVYHTPQGRIETDRGLFVQPSNSGTFRRTHFDGVGELAAQLGYSFTDHLRATVGYTFLYWADPLRAASQIDRQVDLARAGGAASRPTIPFAGSDFRAQGVSVGLELTW